jgi:hypothetical protein
MSTPFPERAQRQGSFRLPLAPAVAFDLFTAEGEREWVDGWEPVILSSRGATAPGAIFLTDHGGEETIWTVIEADRANGRLKYSRVSPKRRAGTVTVRLRDDGEGSVVDIAYDITALGPEGERAVKDMDEAGFAAMLQEWERLIRGALERR